MKRILFIALLIQTSLICFSQDDWKPGYIIINQGDTINGFIDNRRSIELSTLCYFRKAEDAEIQTYTPIELVGYRFSDGRYFVSKTITLSDSNYIDSDKLKTVFLEFMVQGKVNLYHYKNINDDYYVAEKDAKIFELRNTKKPDTNETKEEYVGLLNYFMQDGDMLQEILETNLEPKSLIGLVEKYHNKVCPNEKCIVYTRTFDPIHLIFGFHGGISLFQSFQVGGTILSDNSLEGLLGCRFKLENVLHWKENTSFVIDFDLQKLTNYTAVGGGKVMYKGQGYQLSNDYYHDFDGSHNIPQDTRNLKVNLNALTLQLPITVNYTFSKGNVRPYIAIGLSNIIVLSQTNQISYFGYVENSDSYTKTLPAYYLMPVIRIGCEFMQKKMQSIDLEVNYQHNLLYINFGYNF